MTDEAYRFDFDRRALPLLALGGVLPATSRVHLSPERLLVRYGLLHFETPLANIVDARVTGPYKLYRALGVRLSHCDSGITFGTSAGPGVCLLFAERVRCFGTHEGATITIVDPEAFVGRWRALAHKR